MGYENRIDNKMYSSWWWGDSELWVRRVSEIGGYNTASNVKHDGDDDDEDIYTECQSV